MNYYLLCYYRYYCYFLHFKYLYFYLCLRYVSSPKPARVIEVVIFYTFYTVIDVNALCVYFIFKISMITLRNNIILFV